LSEYGLQLREKQKVKRTYGFWSRSFDAIFRKAARSKEVTGSELLFYSNGVLNNVVYVMALLIRVHKHGNWSITGIYV